MHDDEIDPDAEPIAAEAALSDEEPGHLLSIRRADGTELVSLSTVGSGEPWSVFMAPGGAVQNAYVGPQDAPIVWVDTDAYEIGRDDDGTYVITID